MDAYLFDVVVRGRLSGVDSFVHLDLSARQRQGELFHLLCEKRQAEDEQHG